MSTRIRSSIAKTHKRVVVTLEVVIPAGVRINELEVKSNWHGPEIKTRKFSLLIPQITKIVAKYAGRANVFDKEKM